MDNIRFWGGLESEGVGRHVDLKHKIHFYFVHDITLFTCRGLCCLIRQYRALRWWPSVTVWAAR